MVNFYVSFFTKQNNKLKTKIIKFKISRLSIRRSEYIFRQFKEAFELYNKQQQQIKNNKQYKKCPKHTTVLKIKNPSNTKPVTTQLVSVHPSFL